MARSLPERMIGAAMLDVSVYEEVEADTTATGQAALVVAIVAIATAIGNYHEGGAGVVGGLVMAFVAWLLWAGLTYVIGTKLFKGSADMGEMLRTLGFAQSPGVLNILGIIPFLGGIVMFIVGIWQLVTGVIAIRQALDFDTGKAILTAVIAWLVVMAVTFLFVTLIMGAALTAGALAR